MAVKLRLTRVGKTKQPHYRVVATDSRSPRDGRFIQIVGTYNPRTDPSTLKIDNAKAVKWLMQGAQPTERVKKLLEVSGAMAEFSAARATKGPTGPCLTGPPRTGQGRQYRPPKPYSPPRQYSPPKPYSLRTNSPRRPQQPC